MRDGQSVPLPGGYFFVVDADGAEVPGTRRAVDPGLDHLAAMAIRSSLERGLGPGCFVEFREL